MLNGFVIFIDLLKESQVMVPSKGYSRKKHLGGGGGGGGE